MILDTICDMMHVYSAMLKYYILSCPYPVIVFAYVTKCYFPIGLILWLLPFGISWLIQGVQWCLNKIVRLFPVLRNICSKLDSVLNSWGLWLEGTKDMEGEAAGRSKKKKRIPVMGIYLVIVFAALVFLVVPYYLESELTGNSQIVCANINQLMEGKIIQDQEFVNQYYTPKMEEKEAAEGIEPEEEETEEIKEPVILHLGEEGVDGSNLRSSPEKISGNIVGVVWGDAELVFEHEMQKTGKIVWVKVSTDDYSNVWISRKLIDEDEVNEFLYFE